jgi:uncharacterized protein YbjT (DUF2867 family)
VNGGPSGTSTIAVAGGTGFLGRHIASALVDGGHRVVVLGRDPKKAGSIPELAGLEARRADVTDPSSLTGVLEGVDAVVGAVQFPNHPIEVPRRGLTYDKYDRQGTENLLAEAKRAGVKRYVYLSGAGARVTSEKTWYRAKGLAERALEDGGIEFAVVRPSWAYGPEDRALNRLAQIARFSPIVPRFGMRPQFVQPVHVDDIALTFKRIFDIEAAWGRIFEIGGPMIMTMEEIIETLLDALGKKRIEMPVPIFLAKLGTAPLVLLPKPPMTPQGIEFAIQDGVVDTAELEKVLDVHPISLREGLKRYTPG